MAYSLASRSNNITRQTFRQKRCFCTDRPKSTVISSERHTTRNPAPDFLQPVPTRPVEAFGHHRPAAPPGPHADTRPHRRQHDQHGGRAGGCAAACACPHKTVAIEAHLWRVGFHVEPDPAPRLSLLRGAEPPSSYLHMPARVSHCNILGLRRMYVHLGT